MITTYDDLVAAVVNWLDMTDLATYIPNMLDMAQLRIEREIKGWENEKVAYLGIPASKRSVALPSDLVKINQLSMGWYTGYNLITNGGFDSPSGWTAGIGWSITDGEAKKDADGTGTLSQDLSSTTSEGLYAVKLTVTSNTSGSLTTALGDTTSEFFPVLGDNILILDITTGGSLVFTPTTTATRINIDDVEVYNVKFLSYATAPWTGEFNIVGGELTKTEDYQMDRLVRLVYTAKLPRLSTSVPTNALFAAHPDLYLFATLAESASFIFEDARIPVWERKYVELRNLINAQVTSDAVEVPKLKQRNPYLI